jgi:hypothetical protein
MMTATNLSEERQLSLVDSATPEALFVWFDMAIENGRQSGASDADILVFMRYRAHPDPEARREFIKAYLRRGFREGWAHIMMFGAVPLTTP